MEDKMSGYQVQKPRGLGQAFNKPVKKDEIGQEFWTTSPITGDKIFYKIVEFSPNEAKTFVEFELNQRSAANLTDFAIRDILPTIQKTGRNSTPIYVFEENDKKVILSGLRRRYAVVNHGKVLLALVFKNLSMEEKKFFAKTLDIYDAPSFTDKALKAIEYRKNLLENGTSITQTELSKEFNVSLGTMNEMLSLEKFRPEFFGLFPSLSAVRQKFIRKLLIKKAFLEIDSFAIEELKGKISEAEIDLENLSTVEVAVHYEKVILSYLDDNDAKDDVPLPQQFFQPGEYGKVAKVKTNKTGQVVSFSAKHLEDEDLQTINEILNKYK